MLEEDRQPLANDDDLTKMARRDDFWIKRLFKWFILLCVVAMLSCVVFYFYREMATDKKFLDAVLGQLKNNIIGIIVAGLAVIGINVRK